MAGEILKFPMAEARPAPPPPRPAPTFETLDVAACKQLLALIQESLSKAEELFEFVDNQRQKAKAAGIESITIEVCALVEGGRLEAIADTLSESIENDAPAHVSTTGMDRVRRVERLLSEAEMGYSRIKMPKKALAGRPAALAAAAPQTDLSEFIWVPVAFFGLVIIGVVAVAILSPARSK